MTSTEKINQQKLPYIDISVEVYSKNNEKFYIETLKPYHCEEVSKLNATIFAKYEPSTLIMGQDANEFRLWTDDLVPLLSQNKSKLSLVMHNSKDKNDIVCSCLGKDYFDDDLPLDFYKNLFNKSEAWKKSFNMLHDLDVKGFNLLNWNQNTLKYGDACYILLIATKSEYIGQGLMLLLLKNFITYAKSLNYKYIYLEATNPITKHICNKYFNASNICEIKYKDLFDISNVDYIQENDAIVFQVINLEEQ